MLRPVIRETNAERTDDHIRDMILAALDSPAMALRLRERQPDTSGPP